MNTQTHTPSVLVLYWSKTGNTKKVADTIYTTIQSHDMSAEIVEIHDSLEINVLDYQLVFCGVPVYAFLPPEPVKKFLGKQLPASNPTQPAAPELPGHAAVMFCTYGGGHTRVREAVPTLKIYGTIFRARRYSSG